MTDAERERLVALAQQKRYAAIGVADREYNATIAAIDTVCALMDAPGTPRRLRRHQLSQEAAAAIDALPLDFQLRDVVEAIETTTGIPPQSASVCCYLRRRVLAGTLIEVVRGRGRKSGTYRKAAREQQGESEFFDLADYTVDALVPQIPAPGTDTDTGGA
ncbi:MAG: hypothetical protein IMZ50_16375 [Candidatus Atribacteria bacterium]|nr:hypothetical protein [Candidatus Atribacteria bacterium]